MVEKGERLLTAMEVALIVGTTVPTLNTWYKWKELHPEEELAKLLPEYQRLNGNRRYWRYSDVMSILMFRSRLPKGRNGILGEVTQKYVKKKEDTNDSKNS